VERENLLAGAGPAAARLPADPEAAAALDAAGGDDARLKDVAARFPASSAAWAALAERAYGQGDPVTAYAFARTGYHRGLDQLRRAGWRGNGPVPWEHEPNRGFLRSLHMLGEAARAIGELDEAARCAQFLYDSSPTATAELSTGKLGPVMEYLLTMTTQVPPGTPEAEVDDVRAREAANTSRLIGEGHVRRLWRPPLRSGEWRTFGLFAAAGDAELERVLASMPLRIWRSDDVTPLSHHPNDPDPPALAIPNAPEYFTRFTLTIPDGTPDEAVDARTAAEAIRAHELADEGHLIRLWTLPPGPGRPNALGLWRARDPVEMQRILDSLPLGDWLGTEVTPLSPHPSDPGPGGTYPPKRLPAGPPGRLTAQEPLPRLR
jgi:muconolactone delta-isomerase